MAVLRRGGVVAFPTETYYGLAVDPFNPAALDRLFAVKRRQQHKPILVLISTTAQLPLLAREVPAPFGPLVERFWPGPLTLVLPCRSDLPKRLTGGTGTVGVRISPHPVAEQLLAAFGGPLTATSANLSGEPAATTAAEVRADFGAAIDWVVDGGITPGGKGSTLVGCREGRLALLRDGVVPFDRLLAAADSGGG